MLTTGANSHLGSVMVHRFSEGKEKGKESKKEN